MGIMGKVIGGTLGFAFGGPLGAIFGAALGHNLHDKIGGNINIGGGYQNQNQNTQTERGTVVFVGIFSLLGKLAKIDGIISEEEEQEVRKFINENMKLSGQEAEMAMKIFYEAEKSNHSYVEYANQLGQIFQNDRRMLNNIMDVLLKIAAADGVLDPNEEKMMLEVSRIFRISQSEYARMKTFYIKETDKYYKILGCNVTDDNEIIKKKYRKMIMEYHPDKIISKDLPKEFVELANQKFREIQEAYDGIKKERNI